MLTNNDRIFAATYILYEESCGLFHEVVCRTPSLEEKAWLFMIYLQENDRKSIQNMVKGFLEKHRSCLSPQFRASRVEIRFLPGRDGIEITDGFVTIIYRFVIRKMKGKYEDKKKICLTVEKTGFSV